MFGYVGFCCVCFRCWMYQWSESLCRGGAVDDMAQVIMCDDASSVINNLVIIIEYGEGYAKNLWVSKIMYIILWMLQLQCVK
jgi:hypothetical protein